MYYTLLAINQILFLYLLATLIVPRKTLFFVKDRSKRKRVPYSLYILGVYIVFFIVCSPLIDNTPERKAEKAKAEQDRVMAIQDSINAREKAISDSILDNDLKILGQLEKDDALSKAGPTNDEWRRQQLLFAQRDSISLDWAVSHLNSSISGEPSRAKRRISEIVKGEWKDSRYNDYYENVSMGDNPMIAQDSKRIHNLILRNRAIIDSLSNVTE